MFDYFRNYFSNTNQVCCKDSPTGRAAWSNCDPSSQCVSALGVVHALNINAGFWRCDLHGEMECIATR